MCIAISGRFLCWIWFICISCRTVGSVYLTLGTAAIDVTRDVGKTNWGARIVLSDIHYNVACNMSTLTKATTKDITSNLDTLILLSCTNVKSGISLDVSRIATTVNTSGKCLIQTAI